MLDKIFKGECSNIGYPPSTDKEIYSDDMLKKIAKAINMQTVANKIAKRSKKYKREGVK